MKWMVKKTFTQDEVSAFCSVTGDSNHIHKSKGAGGETGKLLQVFSDP